MYINSYIKDLQITLVFRGYQRFIYVKNYRGMEAGCHLVGMVYVSEGSKKIVK